MFPLPRAQPDMRLPYTLPGFVITSGRGATDGETQMRARLPSVAAVLSARWARTRWTARRLDARTQLDDARRLRARGLWPDPRDADDWIRF